MSSFGGAIILTGRDHAVPVLDAMTMAVRHSGDDYLNLVVKEKTLGHMSLNLTQPTHIDSLSSIRSIDHFCASSGKSFGQPLLVPSMRKDIRETISSGSYWMQGAESPQAPENGLCKLLANMPNNATDQAGSESFSTKVQKHLFGQVRGEFTAGLFLNGTKSNIIIANRSHPEFPTVGLAITKRCVALTWFSRKEVCLQFADRLRAAEQEQTIQPVLVPLNAIRNSVIVIHPLHLISKWQRAMSSSETRSPTTPFVALNVISKYIFNSTLSIRDPQ